MIDDTSPSAPDTSADVHGEGPAEAAAEARISSIISDPTVPESEKRLRLEELLRELGEDPSEAEDYAPIQTQLMHALALLADGGHDSGHGEALPANADLADTPFANDL